MPDTLFENEFIRQGILLGNEFTSPVTCTIDPKGMVMLVGDVLNEISEATGWKQAKLATTLKVSQGTISKWRSGAQSPNKSQWDRVLVLIRKDVRLAHLRHEAAPGGTVAVVGKVGAGSIVEPDFDQTAPEGLYDVTLPFPIPEDLMGLVVDGDSMLPKYDPGDVIVVWREQRRNTLSYLGQLVAVRTGDGRRYLKKLFSGSAQGLFRLESFNAATIQDVTISWVGEIHAIVPAVQVFKIASETKQPAPRRRAAPAARAR